MHIKHGPAGLQVGLSEVLKLIECDHPTQQFGLAELLCWMVTLYQLQDLKAYRQ